jgi:uncharacterized protein (DUF4213/DUF364 family)
VTEASIVAEYVALAERVAACLRSPRVRALYLPPPGVEATSDAEFCAIELDGGAVGFSFALMGQTLPLLRTRPDGGGLAGIDAAALAREYASADPAAKALGFAAINALSQQLHASAAWTPPRAGGPLGAIEPNPGEHLGMVGLFRPLVAGVREAGARLTVLELRPDLAGEYEGARVTLDPSDLASCERVVCTCAVMLNDTLDDVLAACRDARHVAIVGPTAGCIPDPLFARGVDSVGGRRVTDAAAFVDAFRRGGKWGEFAEKYVIERDAYPGVEALLERAGVAPRRGAGVPSR